MKFTFVVVEQNIKEMSLQYGYCLKISTPLELFWYMLAEDKAEEIFKDFGEMLDGKTHGRTTAIYIDLLCKMNNTGFARGYNKLFTSRNEAMRRALIEYPCIYVQKSGGWFVDTEYCVAMKDDVVVTDKLFFPDALDKPRYLKWPGGTHYYVKIGSEDIVVDGVRKWDSRELAEKAYKKWRKAQ